MLIAASALLAVVDLLRRDWGGDGCLGCGVGAGYLHSLPRKRCAASDRGARLRSRAHAPSSAQARTDARFCARTHPRFCARTHECTQVACKCARTHTHP
eukprot:6198026-Pleurochrysis_carterae.AAC.2